jgi:Phage tail lysozyme
MRPVKIGVALALAASLCTPAVAGSATADDRQGVNSRGMSPNTRAAAVEIHWDKAKRAFNFFVGKGLSKRQAAGIVGNLIVESGVDPTQRQLGGGVGRGIAQWSAGGRWDAYSRDNNVWFAGTINQGRWLLNTQMRFTWFELTSYSYYGLGKLRNASTIAAATRVFMTEFEGCGTCHAERRVDYAKQAFNRFT